MDESGQESSRPGSLTLRFLAAPTDVAFLDDSAVAGGRVLKWIDKAAFGCAGRLVRDILRNRLRRKR